jgi:hypothetical protein
MDNFYNQIYGIALEYQTYERIIIIGKGGSVDEIGKDSLANAFIINVNDSERFFPGHFSIFHSPWVYQSIRENGFF